MRQQLAGMHRRTLTGKRIGNKLGFGEDWYMTPPCCGGDFSAASPAAKDRIGYRTG
jgi:hypothetical protein